MRVIGVSEASPERQGGNALPFAETVCVHSALSIDPSLPALLDSNRESLVRRWLMLAVERADFADLSERPLGDRVRELDLLLEAARGGVEPARTPVAPANLAPRAETALEGPPAGVTPLFPHPA